MLDSKEQVQQRLPIPLPKVKFESLDESDDETDNDVPAATPNARGPVEGDPKVPSSSTQVLADQIHALTTRYERLLGQVSGAPGYLELEHGFHQGCDGHHSR